MTFTAELASKVTASHLGRDAYVYVRQSTLTQMRENTESLERQYELASRAQILGWPPQQVVVVDADLGRSGAEATAREGFKSLVADVGLGKVGIVLGIEVSRLARNNADWYQLLDLCALTDTLIADGDGLYHPGNFNDRLVLGLKGTMSEAELHLIRHRLTAGLLHKAAKGELRQGLPVGFVYDEEDSVTLDPDEAVVESIATVFRRFEELGSARQVMLSLLEDNVLVPRRPTRSQRISWRPASYPAIHDFLTNPTYAGAFVFGRRRQEKRLDANGRLVSRTKELPRAEWAVLIPDHHPGFVTWERYERIQEELRANWRAPRGQGGGPVREGTALLQGRIRCGACGRMMQVGYSGTRGDCPRYICGRNKQLYGGERGCQSIGGRKLERRILDEIFVMLEPASLAATAQALAEADANHRQRINVFELSVERSRFEAERARRQFDAVEPENRLVARTLERSLEQALVAQRQSEADLAAQRLRQPTRLTEEETAWLGRAGADVRAIFHAATTTWRERKQLIRALIAEIVVTVRNADRQADVAIIWEGGAKCSFVFELNRPGGHFRVTDEDTVDLVRRLAERYDDKTIATILSKQKRRTGTGLSFTKTRVASLRVSRSIPAYSPPEVVTPSGDDVCVVSLSRAVEVLKVSRVTLYRWLNDGFIEGEQLTPGGPWHIRITDELRQRIAPQVPKGWLGLEQAAKALGMARQTVLHKVQRGELQAVHVNSGRRKGLRINVNAVSPGLFETTL
jgi:DNA invertase Pin-like site-specific DNA recombinase